MHIATESTRLRLDPRRTLRLTGAQGARLRSLSGTIWLTVDNDVRDFVLERDEEFVVESTEPVVLLSLGGPACVALRGAAAAPQPVPAASGWRQLVRAARAWWPAPSRASSAAAR